MYRPIKYALALIATAILAVATTARASSEKCSEPILAMTYNIRLDTPADGENAWIYRRDFLIGQFEIFRPSLLGMQEVLTNQRTDIMSALSGYEIVGGGRDDGKLAGEASPIAIDLRIFSVVANGTFWLSPTPHVPSRGWDAAYPRVATWAHLIRKSDGERVLVINTHWDHEGELARVNSGQQLGQWISRNRGHTESVVLLGDFNTDLDDPSVTRMLKTAALLPAVRRDSLSLSEANQSSFNNYDPFPQPGKVIDHIFVSKSVSVKLQMVIAQHLNGRVASDHFPVAALLEMPQNGEGCTQSRE